MTRKCNNQLRQREKPLQSTLVCERTAWAAAVLLVTLAPTIAPASPPAEVAGRAAAQTSRDSSPPTTSTTLVSSQNPIQTGQNLTLTVTVAVSADCKTSGDSTSVPTGSVALADDGSTIGTAELSDTGQASISVSSLVPGTHCIVATYIPTGAFTGSQSAPVLQLIFSTSPWTAMSISSGPDYNARMLWDNVNGEADLWIVNSSFQVINQVIYGPYPGWTATSVSTDTNNNSLILWINANGAADLWYVNTEGAILNSAMYGPYPGWTPIGVSTNNVDPSNATMIWDYANGLTSYWIIASSLTPTGWLTFGPYLGWYVTAVFNYSVRMTDILWESVNGSSNHWTIDEDTGDVTNSYAFGPFSGFSPFALSADAQGDSLVLFRKPGGSASLWTSNPGLGITSQAIYGPYPEFTPIGVTSVGFFSPSLELLWDNANGAADLWNIPSSGSISSVLYGPY